MSPHFDFHTRGGARALYPGSSAHLAKATGTVTMIHEPVIRDDAALYAAKRAGRDRTEASA